MFSEGEKGQMFTLWRKQGNVGADWQYAHVEVGNSHDFRVSFIATRGGDDKTDIAIDEIRFTHGCEEGGECI